MQTAINYHTREEYLRLEEVSPEKHEFYHGEIFSFITVKFLRWQVASSDILALKST